MSNETEGAVLSASELSKWIGEVVAVNNLHVSIAPGVTGLLGPNGAGKTTFIKLALGLYEPSRGSIKLFGEAPRNNLRLMARIGYCPESDTFHEGVSGYEFVYWLARYSGLTKSAARKESEEALELVGMAGRMRDPIATYSRGMRQRAKIAQSLVGNPDLLFLDEPLAGLDPEGRELMYSLVRRLGDEGCTVIVSSHILYEIERVTSRVVLLHNGSILARRPGARYPRAHRRASPRGQGAVRQCARLGGTLRGRPGGAVRDVRRWNGHDPDARPERVLRATQLHRVGRRPRCDEFPVPRRRFAVRVQILARVSAGLLRPGGPIGRRRIHHDSEECGQG